MAVTAAVIVPAVGTAVVAPLMNYGLQELRSRVEKHISLADLHKDLNQVLDWLLASQKDKDEEASSFKQKDTSNVYRLWTNRVSNIEKEVTSLNNKYEEVRKNKFPRGWKKRRLKKKIKRALKEGIDLYEKCPKEILVNYKLPERAIEEASARSIAKYPTLQKAMQNIRALLQTNGVKCVALHGQKGVGKTTVIQNLNNHFYDNSVDKELQFDLVILIKVEADEQTKDLHILQKIANRMKADREGNESEVVGRILQVLENRRYLLILDGIRHPLDEIWERLEISKDKRDSKVVITTHYPLALKSKYVDMSVKLNILSDDEAWGMFQDIVGDNHLPKDAELICKRFCSGLPLLIGPIARSFKCQESPPDWQNALEEETPWPEFGVEGLEELSLILKICYQQLRDQSEQKCFLYASLYPANNKIYTHYFVECCIVQGFLGAVDATTKYSGMRSQAIDVVLKHLVNIAFLEEGEQMRYVKMNDLYRQLALHVSSKYSDSGCTFRTYVDNEDHEDRPLRSESWQHARWVSMVGSERDSPPSNLCESLQTLLLQKNLRLDEIPSVYFHSMSNLLVLNLHGTQIRELPSLSGLTGLKAFYLSRCSNLLIIPSQIEPLQLLEVFDIRGIRVGFVPRLQHLRCLRISHIARGAQGGDQHNYHLIPELQKLEELVIEVKSLSEWCDDAEFIIQKVASLESLTTFRCSFPSPEALGKFLDASRSWGGKKQFTSFQFFVGCENSEHPKIIEAFDYRISKYVKYCHGDKKNDLAINKLLSRAEAFELICHSSVGNLSEVLETLNVEHLHGLLIERCNQMSVVINDPLPENASVFPNLEQLYVDNMLHLRCVFRGSFHHGSFSRLHTLTLKNCPVLTSIFSGETINSFPKLQKLEVQNCSAIEILMKVKEVTNESEKSVLPKLKMLILDNLLNLRSICRDEKLKWTSLEQLHVQKCPEVKALPFNRTNAPKLRTIEGEKEWWSNLERTAHEVHKQFEYAFSAST